LAAIDPRDTVALLTLTIRKNQYFEAHEQPTNHTSIIKINHQLKDPILAVEGARVGSFTILDTKRTAVPTVAAVETRQPLQPQTAAEAASRPHWADPVATEETAGAGPPGTLGPLRPPRRLRPLPVPVTAEVEAIAAIAIVS